MLWARSFEIDTEDLVYAVKHILRLHNPGARWQTSEYEAVRDASFRMMRDHYRFPMAAKMLLKPLGLGAVTARCVIPVTAMATRFFLMR